DGRIGELVYRTAADGISGEVDTCEFRRELYTSFSLASFHRMSFSAYIASRMMIHGQEL
ncbi:MAG: hypothetical protein QOC81_4536, partial [Thermoanaerobaculia bacterium]|nr:hypothetical protein [Thermoanaerobaculia bacterium]